MTETELWSVAEDAVIGGDDHTLERLLREHQRLFQEGHPPASTPGGLAPDYSAGDARAIIATNHQFASWDEYAAFRESVHDGSSAIARFEAAADAIVSGNLPVLARLLETDSTLIRARSARTHHSTLMHYVGPNGIEYFRQRTPKNAPDVARLLLRAGADVNATADIYGGGATTFGLAATSITPVRAGVLVPLLETLLDGGASVDFEQSSLVNGCLRNGRDEAARFLSSRGAYLDLEGAAGVGRLDHVRQFFDEEGHLALSSTPEQMKDGFAWACEFGHTDVVSFLLGKGMDVGARLKHHGQTGLHWAAGGGHVETVKVLLAHGATVTARDEAWEATPVEWTLYGWSNHPSGAPLDGYYGAIALLVAAGAEIDREILEHDKIRSDPRMLAALGNGP